jgi:hypothetical protein
MKKLPVFVLIGLLTVALGVGIVLAESQWGSSANYAIPWDVVSGGGNDMASANYAIKSTSGQTAIGPGSSSNFTIGAGYWHGLGERLFKIFLPLEMKNIAP